MGDWDEGTAFCIFKDCLARRLLSYLQSVQPKKRTELSPQHTNDADSSELDDFSNYLASEAWPTLPPSIHNLAIKSKSSSKDDDSIDIDFTTLDLSSTSPSFIDTLIAYDISADLDDAHTFLSRVLEDYSKDVIASQQIPIWRSTRADACEICERDVPLTYHHLIPRSVHAKVLKRKWHPEDMLNSVAWLCRACHSAVHHVASNEVLAREYYTVELLMTREDIQKWSKYAARQRYGKRRG